MKPRSATKSSVIKRRALPKARSCNSVKVSRTKEPRCVASTSGRSDGLVHIEMRRELPNPARSTAIPFDPSIEAWKDVELRARTMYLDAVMRSVGGNNDRAIARSGLSKSQFYAWKKELKPSRSSWREAPGF